MVSAAEDRPPSGTVFADPARGDVRLDVVTTSGPADRPRSVSVHMQWRPDDPLAVWIQVVASPDHPALPRGRWAILRDFLRYGMEERTGDGDVQITPDMETDVVHLDLARPTRPCRVSVPATLLENFLVQTELRVPLGDERPDDLVDEFIARLLR